jgi:DNA repair protein RadC
MKLYQYTMTPHCVCEDHPVDRFLKPEDILSIMKGAFDERPEQEQFWVVFLNRKNVVMGRYLLTIGTSGAVLAHPREILRAVLMAGASGFVCIHNHPSGDPSPSNPDVKVTRLIREASLAVDLSFLDHVIIGDPTVDPCNKGYYSCREAGVI